MKESLLIAIGGALGALCRYWVGMGAAAMLGRGFPYGTLLVNVLGSLSMGVLFVAVMERLPVAFEWRAFAMIGFLGAFTTFSAFSLETLLLFQEGAPVKAAVNVLANVTLCVGAAFLGYAVARHFHTNGI